MTEGRRVSPIRQIQCIGGPCGKYEPTVIQCKNVGNDGFGNIQWKCDAELDQSVIFGETTVSCEGYNYREDPYVLKGSCGLEYTLETTNYGAQPKYDSHNYGNTYQTPPTRNSIPTLIMYAVVAFILFSVVRQCIQNANTNVPSTGNTGSDYGGGDGPYGRGNGNGPSTYQGYPKTSSSYPSTYPSSYPSTNTGSGFWTGLGTGSLLGFLFGRRGGYSSYGGYSNYGGYSAPRTGGYGGGFGGGFSSGSSTRTSSGFGGTRRR